MWKDLKIEHFLDLLKVVHCMCCDEWSKALGVSDWASEDEFEAIWNKNKQRGVFEALCAMDQECLDKLLNAAYAKQLKNHGPFNSKK